MILNGAPYALGAQVEFSNHSLKKSHCKLLHSA
jgi:hypothetical protein